MRFPLHFQPKVLIALTPSQDADSIAAATSLSTQARVQLCTTLPEAEEALARTEFDLVITQEDLARERLAGVVLAERCRTIRELSAGRFGPKVILLVPDRDWDRVHRARQSGASVVVGRDVDKVVRYVETALDEVTADALLGPTLYGIHKRRAEGRNLGCEQCVWVGATISYCSSDIDLRSTPVREALLNALMFVRRGQTPSRIFAAIESSKFLRSVLHGKSLKESALKMEICRLRHDLDESLRAIGAPYQGAHFLPQVGYGEMSYRLAGNWNLVHLTGDETRERSDAR